MTKMNCGHDSKWLEYEDCDVIDGHIVAHDTWCMKCYMEWAAKKEKEKWDV